MAWVNSGYMLEATDELRLAKARAYHAEILDAISADVGKDGASRSSAHLHQLIKTVEAYIMRKERATGTLAGYARRSRPGR